MAWRCSLPDGRVITAPKSICDQAGGVFLDTTPGFRITSPSVPATPSVETQKMAVAYRQSPTLSNSAFAIPSPTRGGGPSANLGLSSFGEDLGRKAVDIGLDWIKSKLIPTSPSTPLAPDVPSSGCPDGQIGIPPACFDLVPGGGTSGGGMYIGYGEAVMGRYGAAMQPAVMPIQVRRCPKGAVLGNDGLCYNSRDLRRSDRAWVPGRKPLLTGGDLNAIARAARAANKMKTQQKRLQKLGLLPKPTSSRRGARPKMLASGAPITVIDT